MVVKTSTGLMELNQITTKMCIKFLSLHCENLVKFVFRDFENWIFSCNHYNGKCFVILDYGSFLKIFKTARLIFLGGFALHAL